MAQHRSTPGAPRRFGPRPSTKVKLLASVVTVAAAASVAGLGTYGTFTNTLSVSSPPIYTTGTVALTFASSGTTNVLSTGVSDMAAGDSAERGFTLSNTGSLDLASITLDMNGTASSLLTTDATNGLQAKIDACSTSWTTIDTGAPYTYTCSGTTTSVLASTPLATLQGAPTTALAGLTSLAHGKSDSLLLTVSLPAGADNSVQGLSSTVSISFTGTQRAGQAA